MYVTMEWAYADPNLTGVRAVPTLARTSIALDQIGWEGFLCEPLLTPQADCVACPSSPSLRHHVPVAALGRELGTVDVPGAGQFGD
jgi:hypothetical protein